MPTFYGVFGQESFHPITGQNLALSYVEIEAATMDDAHAVMWATFGSGWHDVNETKPVSPPDSPSGGTYTRIALPETSTPRTGETVTLRVVLTEQMTQENALFIAGRCVAHRPGPGCTTRHGAAVWFEDNVWSKAWNAAGTFSIGGAGKVVLLRYVPRERAEAAVAADPTNLSIVEGSSSNTSFGVKPDASMGPREMSGLFTSEMLHALSKFGQPYEQICRVGESAIERAEELKSWRDSVVGVEVRDGRVVGVRMTSR